MWKAAEIIRDFKEGQPVIHLKLEDETVFYHTHTPRKKKMKKKSNNNSKHLTAFVFHSLKAQSDLAVFLAERTNFVGFTLLFRV